MLPAFSSGLVVDGDLNTDVHILLSLKGNLFVYYSVSVIFSHKLIFIDNKNDTLRIIRTSCRYGYQIISGLLIRIRAIIFACFEILTHF